MGRPTRSFPAFMQRAPTLAAFTSLVPCEKARDAAVEGWDLKAYRKNPVVLFAHDASAWPVGRAVKIGVERDRLVAEVQFANTHEGRKAQHLVETGHLKATSVGFRVLEAKPSTDRERQGGYDFKRQELMEFSIVPVPANPECLICMSAEEERAERKAELRANLAEIKAKGRELDRKYAKLEPKPEHPALLQARAMRAERARIAAMDANELREHMNAKRARKAELLRRAEALRVRS